ncbi:pentapeptide repeat-containing protein [Bradyrhizobium sp. Arg237L]|uniref:pentapeptide repeat-containing protein n=1 Tax=Bradyrhizobium sp. Arg237L TaxID=3003352 RepID=UPI00249ED81A|nr:pentapeptide repeat-containing protein [Bradyrhizobium sp. Arg237L]MDI4234154.1 pentapeptide repeat-containing protein [Bradyrhizobium sp. Arg237L]
MDDVRAGRDRTQASGLGALVTFLVIGIVIGSVLSWALLFGALDVSAPWIDSALHTFIVALGLCATVLVVVIPTSIWAVRKFLGSAKGSLDSIVLEVGDAAKAYQAGKAPQSIEHVQRAALEALAWYTPRAARRWVVQTSLALLVTLGGLAGTALIFRQTLLLSEQNKKLQEQTSLLKEQNDKLDLQTISAEAAQRRATLTPDLIALLQIVASNSGKSLGEAESVRLAAYSLAATPYLRLEVVEQDGKRTPTLSERPQSTERGQILLALITSKLKPPPDCIFEAADLQSAQLDDADLSRFRLPFVNFRRAHLEAARLNHAILDYVDMQESVLTKADFRGASLVRADLSQSRLQWARFDGARMPKAKFIGSSIGGASFEEADLDGADFTRTNQRTRSAGPGGMPFAGALNMSGAILTNADFTGAELVDYNNWDGAIVGSPGDGPLPDFFPRGWNGPPAGWKLVKQEGHVVLRRLEWVPPNEDGPEKNK